MQQTFMLETDSLLSSILGVYETMIFIESGLRWVNTKGGISLAINRQVSGSGNIECHIFILPDARLNIINREIKSVTH